MNLVLAFRLILVLNMVGILRCFQNLKSSVHGRLFSPSRYLLDRAFSSKKALRASDQNYLTPVTIVDSKEEARRVLKILESQPSTIWACDTEVVDIDIKEQSPVGNGKVICASIYGGDQVNFGSGSTLWIDNTEGLLNEFKAWFESHNSFKVWHNYGFDRHVMYNEGIDCKGFFGDTMHMARLWDTSRDKSNAGGEGYSLASLSSHFFSNDKRFVKTSMKDLFGVTKLKKDGTPSKIKELPDLRALQENPESRNMWIEYSARDAVATWLIHRELEDNLKKMPWVVEGKTIGHMLDFYQKYLKDFGELLTDMERNGIKVDTKQHLHQAEIKARAERDKYEKIFLSWASKFCKDVEYINIASTAQIQQLLFGHYEGKELISRTRSFKIEKSEAEYLNDVNETLRANPYAQMNLQDIKKICKERGIKLSGKKSDLIFRILQYDRLLAEINSWDDSILLEKLVQRGLSVEGDRQQLINAYMNNEAKTYLSVLTNDNSDDNGNNNSLKKHKEITIETVGMVPIEFTETGMPQVSASVLKRLAGKNLFGDEKDIVYGDAYKFFGGGDAGKEACQAVGALAAVGQVDATISNFLVPLQALVDKNSRIHCSLNLNTETGRLSSRRPNLQNQPALEKDQYKIRDAFVAEEGHTFIVADYGQLELRILAHVTSCKSMIDAFAQGGCFHSRTAMGMYSYIREAVDSGQVMLEWDYSKGQPTVPLVKDTYGSERRKAKTLNFSIAYGKTVHGLAQDWGITEEEAGKTLDAWYGDRPEVKTWQQNTQYLAKKTGYVRTIMGRYRRLPDAIGSGAAASHALRAAINTPIQGSAADIVMMAMIKLWKSEVLSRLGWKLLLQIHDEVILEGPKATREEAMTEVRRCMENPFDGFGLSKLLVHLDVDAKSADSWYKAK